MYNRCQFDGILFFSATISLFEMVENWNEGKEIKQKLVIEFWSWFLFFFF